MAEPLENLKQKAGRLWVSFTDLVIRHIFWSVAVFISAACMAWSTLVYFAEKGANGANINSYGDALWWGVVTLLTVGFGDKYPVTTEGRYFAFMLMISGVTAVGVLTAKISSFFLERTLNDRRGHVDQNLLNNHLVICGWKSEMQDFLLRILQTKQNLEASDIVLVNNVSDEQIEGLHDNPILEEVKVVKGDFFVKSTLERAAPERARKVLILADQTPDLTGKMPTVTEADARTVMTAMTLNNMAKKATVVAEILDADMDQYLKLANVNEIIYSRVYSRMLMAKSADGNGIPNIIHHLLDPESNSYLTTKAIPQGCFNKTYFDMVEQFKEQHPGLVVIGLLENSGNTHTIKDLALKKAQQTPDIESLVSSLRSVKTIKFNNPVFSPTSDYTVNEGSLAIVIENRLFQVEEEHYVRSA